MRAAPPTGARRAVRTLRPTDIPPPSTGAHIARSPACRERSYASIVAPVRGSCQRCRPGAWPSPASRCCKPARGIRIGQVRHGVGRPAASACLGLRSGLWPRARYIQSTQGLVSSSDLRSRLPRARWRRFPPPLFPHGSLSPPAGRDGIMRSATAPHAGAGEASEAATPGASVTAQHGDRHTAALDTPGQGSPMRHCSLEGRSNSKQHGSAGPGLEDAAAALAGVADSPAMAAAAEPLSKPRLRVQGADIILEDAPSPKAPTPVEPSASSRQLAAAAALGNGGGVASSPAAAAAPAGAQQHAQAAALQQHHVVAAARASQSHEHELQLRLASRTVTGLSNLAVVSSRPTMQINSGGHGIADERCATLTPAAAGRHGSTDMRNASPHALHSLLNHTACCSRRAAAAAPPFGETPHPATQQMRFLPRSCLSPPPVPGCAAWWTATACRRGSWGPAAATRRWWRALCASSTAPR